MKKGLLLLFLALPFWMIPQKLTISGTFLDTVAKKPLQHAVVMAIKLSDSLLVGYSRTNKDGLFTLKPLPVDTYQVLITHPQFADQGFFIFGDKEHLNYDFGKIIAQAKSLTTEEVTVFAFKDPIYYKGDTLIYTADSFKVRANANVEDLLKKLPGMKVDAQGKITSQGKQVDKVFVDGDEFFGGDPTIATKNLAANSIESVQVYDRKSEDASNSSTGEETQKILNLKLKEDAKKGYFGKVSGASDFQKFYEGEALGNYFKKQLKVSVFGLATNTPKSGFGWNDLFKYGLGSGNDWNEEGEYTGEMPNTAQGIPQTLKTGFYFSNKFSPKTKINANYSFNTNILNASSSTNSQFFLTDTNYTTSNLTQSLKKNQAHVFNFTIDQKIDSLTDFVLTTGAKSLMENTKIQNQTDFIGGDTVKSRNTDILNTNNNSGYEITNNLKFKRRFKKKDRLFVLNYTNAFLNSSGDGILKTENTFYAPTTLTLSSINQKKDISTNNLNHYAGVTYTEPLSKKIKLEMSYDWNYFKSSQNKLSLNNIGGEYNVIDSNFTNNFINSKYINRAGLKFIYEVKKFRIIASTKVRNVFVNNVNLFANTQLTQNFNNIMPFASFRYKPSENASYDISYKMLSNNPTITQLQPVKDNTNQNFINIGNPNLLPTQQHQFNVNFNSWKPISGKYYWAGLNYNYINKDFSYSTNYDSLGRTIAQSINVDGNFNYGGYLGFSYPFYGKKLELQPNIYGNYSKNKDIINGNLNSTTNFNGATELKMALNLDSLTINVGATYDYYSTSSSLNSLSNKPYNTQTYIASFNLKLPQRFTIESDASYIINGKRADGYNVNYFVWNASVSRSFLKTENLLVGFYAYDMLNQNINIVRNITSNVISDVKTNVISRYFLLKITFKFNSNKTKEDDDEM